MELKQLCFDFVKEGFDRGLKQDELTRVVRKTYIVYALELTKGNQCKTANILGWHRNTLSRQMKDLDINATEIRQAFTRGGKKKVGSVVTESVKQQSA